MFTEDTMEFTGPLIQETQKSFHLRSPWRIWGTIPNCNLARVSIKMVVTTNPFCDGFSSVVVVFLLLFLLKHANLKIWALDFFCWSCFGSYPLPSQAGHRPYPLVPSRTTVSGQSWNKWLIDEAKRGQEHGWSEKMRRRKELHWQKLGPVLTGLSSTSSTTSLWIWSF